LTVLEPIVRERLLSFEVDQATQVARARVALRPGRIDLLADLKQRFGVVVDPPAPIVAEERTAERLRKLAESLFDATARVAACTRWLERIEWAQARLGDLDVELGVYQDQIAKLTAELEEVQESIARLKGSAAGSPKAEQATTRQGEEDRSTLEQGEIAWLRQRRLKALILASLGTLGWLLLVPFIALLMIRGGKSVGKRILKRIESEPEQAERTLSEQRERMERARTLVTTFRTVWNAVVIVLAIAYLLKAIRVDVTPLVASAGIVGLAFAFGSQALVRDYVSGFFILLESQYNLGDVVTINGTGGRVEKITLRMTVLRDIEGAVHFIPNGTVTSVTNRMKAWSQAKLEIGVAYKEDPDRVMACLQGVGEELMLDEVFKPLVTAIEVPGLEQFGDSSIIFRVHLKVAPGEQWRVAREYRRRVKYAFDREGIEIPFPQRVIHQSWVRETREAAAERSVVDPRSGDAPTPNDLTVER
jgi:small conductance mechanosensitive channel